ncbi:MAG TPA: hypothetical protein VMB50_21600 [Myxococcales bacterium]|nr:hypothetical protein [Myxococcales bacterium]
MAHDGFEDLAGLPSADVAPEAAARMRAAALVRFSGRPTGFDRLWTDFFELPATALVVAVHLIWAVHAASTPAAAALPAFAARDSVRPRRPAEAGRLLDLPHLSRSD